MPYDTDSESVDQPVDFDVFGGTVWTDAVDDVDGTNIFTAEIENVDSSEWEMDPDVIWGDDPGPAPEIDGGSLGPDLLV